MHRYFLEISYNGKKYNGLQVQKNASSIQGALDNALSTILNHPIKTTCASRTDKGVHARQNFLHFDLDISIPEDFLYRMNIFMPNDIVLKSITPVQETSHSRFDATERKYEYHIHFNKNPFLEDLSYRYRYGFLDTELMNKAAKLLMDFEDFTSFCKPKTDVKTKICNIKEARWEKIDKAMFSEQDCLVFHITANRFLRGMVRAIVGTLILVGKKALSIDDFKNIILSKNPQMADFSPPPQGLYLTEVIYPYL